MKNLVSAARARAGKPEISVRNAIKTGLRLYVVAATFMFLLGFFSAIYQGFI